MKCAVYLRVSTEDQAERDTPIESQKPAILEWAERNGASILPDWVIDDRGFSGSTAERPGFRRLLDAARNGPPFDTLLVYSYDRLFRNNRKMNRYLDELEDDYHVRVVSVTEAEEPELLVDIRSVINEEARRAIIKHTKRAMREIALRGHSTGGTPPYGYRRKELPSTSGNRPVVWEMNPEQARVVRQVFRLYAAGASCRKIAWTLNAKHVPSPGVGTGRQKSRQGWCMSAVRVILLNETYRGWRLYQKTRKAPGNPSRAIPRPREEWIIVKGAHRAIVEDELWNEVHARRERMNRAYNSVAPSSDRGRFPLSGLVKCGQCGANFAIVHGHQHEKCYYGCPYARDRGPAICQNKVTVERARLEAWVYGLLKQEVLKPEVYAAVCRAVEEELEVIYSKHKARDIPALEKRLAKDVARIQGEIAKLVAALKLAGRGGMPAIVEELKQLEARKAGLEEEKRALAVQMEKPAAVSRDVIEQHVKELVGTLQRSNPLELRAFLREHVQRIVIYPTGRKRLYPTPDGLLHKALTALGPVRRSSECAGSGIESELRQVRMRSGLPRVFGGWLQGVDGGKRLGPRGCHGKAEGENRTRTH